MRYVKSRYNLQISEFNDGVLVFNSLTASILWVPYEYWKCDEYIGEITDNWEELIASGIWIADDRNEFTELESIVFKKMTVRDLCKEIWLMRYLIVLSAL